MLAIGDSPGRLPVFRNIKCLCTLRGSRRYVLRWQGYASLRGLYELGPASLRCADPLGLFPFTLTASETARLFVYPAPGFTGLRSPGGIPLGSLVSPNPFHEDLNRRRSLREYNPGDEMRRINWKATAKNSAQAGSIGAGGGIMVNEYDATLSYPLVVFLNADPAEYSLKNRELHLERAIEAAAALCLMASRERQTLGFIVHTGNGREGVINPGAFTLIPILERLAVLERRSFEEGEGQAPGLGGSVKRLLDEGKFLPFGTRLVYAGPGLADEGYRVLESLRRYHITLEYVVIQEQTLPPVPGPGSRRYQMKESGYEIL
jgi:hypothetical protein